MCIGIPVLLVERSAFSGIGEIEGMRRHISLVLVPEANVGDYILVHAGCGLRVIDEQAAADTLDLLRALENEAY
jgi:hydrogenase expression/formation protein HypC